MKKWELLQEDDRRTHPIRVTVKTFPGEYGYATGKGKKWHVIFANGIEGNFDPNDCKIILRGKKVTLLNTSILTSTGVYLYEEISLEEARHLWRSAEIRGSAIGHEATAQILRTLFDDPGITINRIRYEQAPDEIALVLKMNSRIKGGAILTEVAQLEEIGYHFAIIKNIESQIGNSILYDCCDSTNCQDGA